MKAFTIAAILALTTVSSVSSAMCMKKFLASQGLAPNPSTNFYNHMQNQNSVPGSTSTVAGSENINVQR